MNARNVLITGASSGIGRALALDLSRRGWRVFATVRDDDDAQRLQRDAGDRLTTVRLDLCDEWLIEHTARWIDDHVGRDGLQALVNNAGIAVTGPVERLSSAEIRQQFSTNVFGAVALSRALLPALQRGGGRIVNLGSSSGRVTLPFAGAYSASKAALAAFTAAMRLELSSRGVRVSLIEAGNVRTPIWRKTIERARGQEVHDRYGPPLRRMRAIARKMEATAAEPDTVVRVVIRSLEARRPKPVYVVGRDARFWRVTSRLIPVSWLETAFRRVFLLPTRGYGQPSTPVPVSDDSGALSRA